MSSFSLRFPFSKHKTSSLTLSHFERKFVHLANSSQLIKNRICSSTPLNQNFSSRLKCGRIDQTILSNRTKLVSTIFDKSHFCCIESSFTNSSFRKKEFIHKMFCERKDLSIVSKLEKREKDKTKPKMDKKGKKEVIEKTSQMDEIPDDLSRKLPKGQKRHKGTDVTIHEPPLQSFNQLEQKLGKKEKNAEKKRKKKEDAIQSADERGNEDSENEDNENEHSYYGKDSVHFWKENNETLSEYNSSPFMDSVVKVFCTHTEPNFSLPWQKKRQFSSTGSGFVIFEKKILTNAHCIEHQTQVKVKRRGDDKKFLARVLAIGRECDIALLTIDDDDFWLGIKPISFGRLPHLQDAISVSGYPIGGDTISVTSGVVSRIEVTSYVHASSELLGCQIDAAINSGNSGGPAFNGNDECVGIAFQSLKSSDAENIGYIIPTPVILHFLNDYEMNKKYTGFPVLGINWQKMENNALRLSLKMNENQSGVLIRRVEPTSNAFNILKQGDVLMKFENVCIGNDGTVPFRKGERISFGFLISQKFSGENVNLEILRDGKILNVSVLVQAPKRLIPIHINGQNPSYFIIAGLVFTPVNLPYLESEYGREYEYESPVRLLDRLLNGQSMYDDHQIVVLSQVLASDVNVGYEDTTNIVVVKMNDVEIKNIKHLAHLVDSCTEAYMKFDLDQRELIVLETESAKAATANILAQYGIPSERSRDLKCFFSYHEL